jgi:striatin 1/3/4
MSVLAAGHENGHLNLFDYNANKVVKTFTDAHTDSISSITFCSSNGGLNLITGSHDGSVKVWDLRTYKTIAEVPRAHSRKYNESVMCLANHSSVPFFASGGADCVVNIYELNIA